MPTAEPGISRDEILRGLRLADPAGVQALLQRAYAVKTQTVGRRVHLRGIIEFSNQCAKDCLYCGIRRGNTAVQRYRMTLPEIAESARWAAKAGYGSLVLQSGERADREFTGFVEEAIRAIRAADKPPLGITLSLGEQDESTYRRWREAGAERYLLRIETSNPSLYARLHPADHSWETRRDCLLALRRTGYQVGTGVMIGLPFQTLEDLADDILFFRNMDIDMIGMGPYVPHAGTPLAAHARDCDPRRQLDLGLRMIALTRLAMPDINIAATTALQALDPEGREKGLLAGANILMPNITPVSYRSLYQLYEGKPCLDENASLCRQCIERRIASIGETIGYHARGDSPHFFKRRNEPPGAQPDPPQNPLQNSQP